MKKEKILKNINEKFKEDIIELFDKSAKRVYIEIKPQSLVKMTSYVLNNLGARFNTASGVDVREHIEILYHFTIEEINLLILYMEQV